MGQKITSWIQNLFQEKEVRILFVGLEGAGKTTILFNLKLDDVVTVPTIGFPEHTINYKGIFFTTWDLGGQEQVRHLWKPYFENTNAVIFVVDSNDKERVGEVRDELHSMMDEDSLKNVPLLVFLNKQDLQNAMDPTELKEELKMEALQRNWYLQPCCAHTGDGLFEGFDWLSKLLK